MLMPKNINRFTFNSSEKIKTERKEKKDNKASEEYCFQQRCMKMSTNSKMASRFLFAAYIVRLLDVMASRFSLAASHRTII